MAIKTKILHIFKDGEEQRIPLDKEKIIIGRDKSCDIVLNHASISRKHAALVNRYENIYVENISSTGAILKNGESVEYADLLESQDISIGPYSLHWRLDDGKTQASEAAPSDSPAAPSSESAPVENYGLGHVEAPQMSEEAPAPEVNAEAEVVSASGLHAVEIPALDSDEANFAVVSADERTQISPAGQVHAMLKITKGETIGREIRLDNGLSWIVGRSAKCHIQIDSAKLSRQHFKIIKIGASFRVEDLGSANGTRVNGVAITDAPLQAFDAIQAGPVEVQFLIVNAQAQAGLQVSAPPREAPALALMDFHEEANVGSDGMGAQDKTLFAPPALYNPGQESTHIGPPPAGFSTPKSNFSGGGTTPPRDPTIPGQDAKGLGKVKEKWGDAVIWFNEQPKQKRILYGSALGVVLLAALMSASQEKPKNPTQIAIIAPERTPASQKLEPANAALSPDISPEFTLLTTEKQNEIRDLYAKAEQARRDKDWKMAFDSAGKVLKSVKRFKNATEILDEAQTYLNEDNIGNISRSLSNVEDASKENQEQLKLLLESGDKALGQKRWDDALESFSKAMNLDPKNEKAARGFAAANARNAALDIALPQTPQIDPEAEQKQAERDQVDGLKRQFQEARAKMNDGQFREGLPILKDLEEKIEDRLHDYNMGRRAPASVRDEFKTDIRQLQSRVKEGLEAVKSHLKAEYQTQLSDAEQFESNRQYVQAREIYDRIIRTEPGFDDAVELRRRLYTKILAEAKAAYQESLIYESVGDLENATEGFQKTRDLLTNVRETMAVEYYKRSSTKLKRLER